MTRLTEASQIMNMWHIFIPKINLDRLGVEQSSFLLILRINRVRQFEGRIYLEIGNLQFSIMHRLLALITNSSPETNNHVTAI